MRRYSDAAILRAGAVSLVLLLLLMAAAFNLSKFPGFRDDTFRAEFADASGLHAGNTVEIGGIRVGRVTDVALEHSNTVVVTFSVDHDADFGRDSTASIEVLNLLGEKFLDIQPAGPGQLSADQAIPLDRTSSAYDIVGVFSDLTTTTEGIDTTQLTDAFDSLGDTVEAAAPEIHDSFVGLSRLSQTVASRDAQIQHLLRSSASVSKVLADRSQDVIKLMHSSTLVFDEVRQRRAAIHRLLVNAQRLAAELRGVATDNQAQIGPALQQVDRLLGLLNHKDAQLKATLAALGPYSSILGNIIGTGPWFDAYVVNLLGIPTGEFKPGDSGLN